MPIVHQLSNSSSLPSPVLLLPAPRIVALLPARIEPVQRPSPDLNKAAETFREALARCATGELSLSALMVVASALYDEVAPPMIMPSVRIKPRFRTLEEMNAEILEQHGDTLRYLARNMAQGGRHD